MGYILKAFEEVESKSNKIVIKHFYGAELKQNLMDIPYLTKELKSHFRIKEKKG